MMIKKNRMTHDAVITHGLRKPGTWPVLFFGLEVVADPANDRKSSTWLSKGDALGGGPPKPDPTPTPPNQVQDTQTHPSSLPTSTRTPFLEPPHVSPGPVLTSSSVTTNPASEATPSLQLTSTGNLHLTTPAPTLHFQQATSWSTTATTASTTLHLTVLVWDDAGAEAAVVVSNRRPRWQGAYPDELPDVRPQNRRQGACLQSLLRCWTGRPDADVPMSASLESNLQRGLPRQKDQMFALLFVRVWDAPCRLLAGLLDSS